MESKRSSFHVHAFAGVVIALWKSVFIDHGESRDWCCFCSDRAERSGRQKTVRQSNQIKITPFIQTPLAQSESERPTDTTMHVHNISC